MKEVDQLKDCYHDFARFMFGTMIEIEKALPKDTAKRNTDIIREIVRVPILIFIIIPIFIFHISVSTHFWCLTRFIIT